MPSRASEALRRRYSTTLNRLRGNAGLTVVAIWDRLGSWDEDDVEPFLDRALPVVEAATLQAANLTAAYIGHLVTLETGEPSIQVAIEAVQPRPAPLAEVYRRPFVQTWRRLAEHTPWEDAVAEGRFRAEQTALTDIQLAARDTAAEVTSIEPRVVGYRRILGAGKNCGLCVVASTQRYSRGDLMPIHPHCGCTIEPIIGQRDPGRVIDRERLQEVQRLTVGTNRTRADYGRLRVDTDQLPGGVDATSLPKVEVVDHGELGPLLTDQSHAFTSLADIA